MTKNNIKLSIISVLALVASSFYPLVASVPVHATGDGIEVGVPAYVYPNDSFLTAIENATPPPSIVILNPNNGQDDFDSTWQDRADDLRLLTADNNENVKVLGYVYTQDAQGNLRSANDVKADIDNYLKADLNNLHVDGIFIDTVKRECGPTTSSTTWRDYYLDLREYIQDTMYEIDDQVEDYVVNNPGTAIEDCYLASGYRTADIYVTYEGNQYNYDNSYLGGNVFNLTNGYRAGTEYDSSSFWHLVYNVANSSAMEDVVDTAFTRHAGYVYATSDDLANPWDAAPSYLDDMTTYAATKD